MPSYQTVLRIFVVSFVAALALVCVLSTAAQSGRRAKQVPPAPIPVPSQEPTPSKPVEKTRPKLTLIVGMERSDDYGLNGTNPGTVLMSVSERLDDSPAVRVEQVRRDMNRSEAIRRAKAEEAAYVVLLELETESRIAVNIRVTEVSIQYSVFSPTTAKVRAFGRTYPHSARNKGVIVNPGTIYGDYQLREAGRQAAEKILDAFNLPLASKGPFARGGLISRSAFAVEPVDHFAILFVNHAALCF